MTNIILCGGNGTRLWPISRNLMPKQFVKLFDDKSLFQLTVQRNSKFCDSQFIVSNTDQYFLALDQIEELNETKSKYLLESVGRSTAPAIALACFSLDTEELLLVTPSDHLVKDETKYIEVLKKAEELALANNLVTFGITPKYAETGFGYIEADEFNVKAFHEKPDLETATKYLENGNYYWNSGIFCFKAGVYLDELKKYSPKIYKKSLIAFEKRNTKQKSVIRISEKDMLSIPEDSIDYAVMEKSKKVKIISSDIGWSDVGSFDSLYNELPQDKDGNTLNSNHISINSKNNFIYGEKRKISTVDIENLIIVDTGDALLVSKKESSQKVKEVVNKIKSQGDGLENIHLTVYRPWGTYTVLEDSPGYKIKRIEVKPNSRLSLQKHFHRNEHWIVLKGTATVTIGNEKKLMRQNESTYIKMGEIHRLENEGRIPLVLIEVQVGEYTAEDDILRIDDDYKRDR